jgi:ribosomal protein L19
MNQNLIRAVEERHLKTDLPNFSPGDTLRVNVRVVEGNRERVQAFEGTCTARAGFGVGETFTVRRVSQGVGIERMFLLHSPAPGQNRSAPPGQSASRQALLLAWPHRQQGIAHQRQSAAVVVI